MVESFQARRQRLLAKVPPQSIIVMRASTSKLRNGDVHYPFRQQSDFFYLTGCEEADAAAIWVTHNDMAEFILFNHERDPIREQWEGSSLGQEGAIAELGADKAYAISSFAQKIMELMIDKQQVYCLLEDRVLLRKIQSALQDLKKAVRSGADTPKQIVDLAPLVHEMRLLKDAYEIACLRQAATISADAHRKTLEACKLGMHEYELQAILEYELHRHGCQAVAYPSIVASGTNSCILHYTDNNAVLKDGDLVLVDAGGEYANYAADITRTYPVNGKFGAEQRAIYEVVLMAQARVIESIKPGVPYDLMQRISEREITQGLIDLGILKGNLDKLLEQKAFQPFYMHRIGHWLGLDVHDAGAYKVNNDWRLLEPGMVLTVEPGIYIQPGMVNVDSRWWGIGVRIEDDILVTSSGCDILSAAVPKSVNEIEAVMAKGNAI